MIIVFLGFDFVCPNKGCEALSYSFVSVLKQLMPDEDITIYNVTYKDSLGELPKVFPDIKFYNHRICFKSPKYLLKTLKLLKKADYVFDITYGDSFSDIYGKKWLFKTNLHKQMAESKKAKLILLPQTYGPFNDKKLKKWSLKIVKNCTRAYSRDQKSIDFLKDNGINDITLVTDLAMALPYDKDKYSFDDNKIKIGLNISSLLWENGFTGKNEFGLKVEYKEYCKSLVKMLEETGKYTVYLIPHVIEDIPEARENDLRSIRELHDEFPKTVMPPVFDNPMEIKSYISNMDVFIGARMHSTIAAFSSGVPVIPFSYSRKFEGLFGNLNYPYTIDGRTLDTTKAVDETIEFIEKRDELLNAENNGMKIVKKLLDDFQNSLKSDMEV